MVYMVFVHFILVCLGCKSKVCIVVLGWQGGEGWMWRFVDGNYGGATQIYGKIRRRPKHRMQTNSFLIPPTLTSIV